MKTQFEIKATDGSVLDVDDKSRRVKVALNKTGVKDSDKDIIEKTAFDKTIKDRGPKGKNLIWHLTDHRPSLKDAVGKFSELMIENDYLVGITDIPETSWGNDVLQLYKSGTINQHSIGFSTIKREVFNDDDWSKRYTVIKEINLYEGSAVLWGANEFTPTLSVGKGATLEERKTELDKTLEDLSTMYKLFRDGNLTDQTCELIEIKVKQLTEKLQSLFAETTQADEKSLEPGNEGDLIVVDFLKQLNNNLKLTV